MKNSKNLSLLSRLGKLQRLFLVALFSVLAIGAAAQSKTVSGTVTDKTGETVIGASVVVKGTTNGTITDIDGKFTISNVPDNGIIQVSFVGYKTQDIPAGGKSVFHITLEEDGSRLWCTEEKRRNRSTNSSNGKNNQRAPGTECFTSDAR